MTSPEDEERPVDIALRDKIAGAVRAKARFVAVAMALAVGVFVYAAADSGVPLWLVTVIGVFGAILIAFFIALVWFWLRFLSPSARKDASDARD